MVDDAALLNTQHYKVCIKGKVEQSSVKVAIPPSLRCSSYWKRNLRVPVDHSRQIYIYINRIKVNGELIAYK